MSPELIATSSIATLSWAMENGDTTASDLTTACLERAEDLNPVCKAFTPGVQGHGYEPGR